MRYKTYIALICFISLTFSGVSLSQEKEKTEESGATKPLELPNFIIQGKEQLNVRSGAKRFPDKPPPLNDNELDSLNSLRKQQSLILPSKPLPDKVIHTDYKEGYVEGYFGRYSTASIKGGYGIREKDYSIFGNASAEYSSGHIKNSDYNQFDINLFSDYNAPEKYFIFGGSKTRTTMKIDKSSYKLYAIDNPPERDALNYNLGIESDGYYGGAKFSTGAIFNSAQLTHSSPNADASKAFENELNGFVKVNSLIGDYKLGGEANLFIGSLRGSAMRFFEAKASGEFQFGEAKLTTNIGIQTAENSAAEERKAAFIDLGLNYRFGSKITAKANVYSGMKRTSFAELFEANPYMKFNSKLDYQQYAPIITVAVDYHPDRKMGVVGGVKFGSIDRKPVFDTLSNGVFDLRYEKVNTLKAFAEGFWTPTEQDNITMRAEANYSALAKNGKLAPYTAPFKASASYRRSFFDEKAGAEIGIIYVASRYVDIENNKELGSYLNANLSIDYRFMNDFKAIIKVDNTLNSDIYYWDEYKERNLFFQLGLVYVF